MKILLVAPKEGYSFVNQATYLSKGLTKIGVENVVLVTGESLAENIKRISPDLLLGVGSWHSYQDFVSIPQSLGVKYIPWIVSDEKIDNFVDQYNQLPLILTPSNFCKDVFVRNGVEEKILKVLPEAVDYDYWQPLPEEQIEKFANLISITDSLDNLPFKYNLRDLKEKGIPILFTTGGDATHKGAREVIEALGKINKEINSKWVYLIKTWPSPSSLQNSIEELTLAGKLGIEENIRYIVGEFSNDFLLQLINLCDIYAAPSRIEGFGLPHVEAALCKKPVIGLSETATAETVIDRETGFIAKSIPYGNQRISDMDNLSDILKELITDKNLRKTLGENGRKKSIERFGPENIARKLMDIVSS